MSEPNTASSSGGVWFFSGDLMFASRVRHAAQRAGYAFSIQGSWPEEPTSEAGWIIVDLGTRSGAAAEIRRRAAEEFPAAATIAYGPHVQPQRLADARRSGYDMVLTRGQFDALLPTLFDTPPGE